MVEKANREKRNPIHSLPACGDDELGDVGHDLIALKGREAERSVTVLHPSALDHGGVADAFTGLQTLDVDIG